MFVTFLFAAFASWLFGGERVMSVVGHAVAIAFLLAVLTAVVALIVYLVRYIAAPLRRK